MKKKQIWNVSLCLVLALACLCGCAGAGTGEAPAEAAEGTAQEAEAPAETAEAEAPANTTAYLSGVNAADYVEIGEYTGVQVEQEKPQVTKEQLDEYLQYILSMSKTTEEVTDRDTVENGDTVSIDYTGKKDGVAFEGGSAEGYPLTIGSHSFIEGFEEGVIGMKVGEEKTLSLTFPENYSNADLAGQEVTFDVKVNSISVSVTPELNDEFAASQGIEGVETAEDLREYVKDALLSEAEASYDADVQSQIIAHLLDEAVLKQDLPEALLARYNQNYVDTLTGYAEQYGMDLATIMQYQGSSPETYLEDIRKMAEDVTKEYLILQLIADRENLGITQEEYVEDVTKRMGAMGYSSVEEFEEAEDEEAFREYLLVQKVVRFLQDNADIREPEIPGDTEDSTQSANNIEEVKP